MYLKRLLPDKKCPRFFTAWTNRGQITYFRITEMPFFLNFRGLKGRPSPRAPYVLPLVQRIFFLSLSNPNVL